MGVYAKSEPGAVATGSLVVAQFENMHGQNPIVTTNTLNIPSDFLKVFV